MTWSLSAGLEDTGVVVTGVGSGIGRAIATAFLETGARVCGIDLTEEAASLFLADADDPSRHRALAFDLTEIDRHPEVMAQIGAELGGIGVLVHAAGLARRQELADVTEADWDLQTDINLKAGFFLDRATALYMREQGRGGSIVNFSSQGWWTGGFGGSVVYNAGKGGIVSLTRGLARTFGPDGIRINAVAPGLVNTPMLTTGLSADALNGLIAQVPLGYMSEPTDIAGTVIFLASDHARYITGTTINITGGWLVY